jgi:SpoVK/Ycf46/Vps4 family AAA+-type ATPase
MVDSSRAGDADVITLSLIPSTKNDPAFNRTAFLVRATKLPNSTLFKVAKSMLLGMSVAVQDRLPITWFGHCDTLLVANIQSTTVNKNTTTINSSTQLKFVCHTTDPAGSAHTIGTAHTTTHTNTTTNTTTKTTTNTTTNMTTNTTTNTSHHYLIQLRTKVRGLDSQLRLLINLWLPSGNGVTSGGGGVLLHGAPGTGKTLAVEALGQHLIRSDDTTAHVTIHVPDLYQKGYGDGERVLIRTIDRTLSASKSALIVLDEIDALGTSGGGSTRMLSPDGNGDDNGDDVGVDPTSLRMLRTVCALLDDISRNKVARVLVIGVTSQWGEMRPSCRAALTQSGRLQHVVECGIPTVPQRKDILELMTQRLSLANETTLDTLAKRTPGFVGTDLADFVRVAALSAMTRDKNHTFHTAHSTTTQNNPEGEDSFIPLSIEGRDWESAHLKVRPSSLRSFAVSGTSSVPSGTPTLASLAKTSSKAVERIQQTTLRALRSPEIWLSRGVQPPSGLLLYGTSGNGKTLLAASIAQQIQREGLGNVLIVRCTDIVGSILGESERALTEVFHRARRMRPCIIVLDQIEAIGRRRGEDDTNERTWDRLLSCLLIELDGMRKDVNIHDGSVDGNETGGGGGGAGGVHIIGTTSDLSRLDPALIRPGRFDDCVRIDPPTSEERKELVLARLKKALVQAQADKRATKEMLEQFGVMAFLNEIVDRTAGMSRADIVGVCREAVMSAIRENSESPLLMARHLLDML